MPLGTLETLLKQAGLGARRVNETLAAVIKPVFIT